MKYSFVLVTLLCYVPSTSGLPSFPCRALPSLPGCSQSQPGSSATPVQVEMPNSETTDVSSAINSSVGTSDAEIVDEIQDRIAKEARSMFAFMFPITLNVNGRELIQSPESWNHKSLWKQFKTVGFVDNTICFYAQNGQSVTIQDDIDSMANLLSHAYMNEKYLHLKKCLE